MYERTIFIKNKIPRIQSELFMAIPMGKSEIICISARAIWVIGFLAHFYRNWTTILGQYVSPKYFKTATKEEFDQLEEVLQEMEDLSMSCNEGLQAIAEAIASLSFPQTSVTQTNENNCNSGSGGCGTTGDRVEYYEQFQPWQGNVTQPGTGETIPVIGTQPPKTIPTGEFPEGYEDEATYLLDKCQVANLVFDGCVQTLRNLGALGTFNAVAVTGLVILALVGMITVPPAAFVLLCAAIGVMATNVTLLAVMANEMENDREEIVCLFYQSDSVEAIVSVLADILDGIIARIPATGPLAVLLKTIALYLLNGDTLNQLFEKVAHLSYPDADCSNCEQEEGYCNIFTVDTDGWYVTEGNGLVTFETDHVLFQNTTGLPWCSFDRSITLTVQSGTQLRWRAESSNFVSIKISGVKSGGELDVLISSDVSAMGAGSDVAFAYDMSAYAGNQWTALRIEMAKGSGGGYLGVREICIETSPE